MSGNQTPLSLVSDSSSSEEMDILLRADPYECRELARRAYLPLIVAQRLFPKFPQEMLDSGFLGELTRTDSLAAKELFENNRQIVRELKVDDEWVKYFIGSSPDIVAEIAANPLLPKVYWDYCAHHHLIDVRRAVAMNPSIDFATVARLSGDTDLMVQRLAEGQMQKRFPAVQMAAEPRHEAQSQDSPIAQQAVESKTSRNGNVQITINPSHLAIGLLTLALLIALGALAMRSPQQSSSVSSPTSGISSASSKAKQVKDAEDTNYAQAIDYANEASALARTSPEAKGDWNTIVSNWDKAIALLEKVSKDEPEFAKAQKKIRSYKVIRSVANGNLEKAK
jgi:hypothetical protein